MLSRKIEQRAKDYEKIMLHCNGWPTRRMGRMRFQVNTGRARGVLTVLLLASALAGCAVQSNGRGGVIIGVDRVLDMCRTVLNVWGDCVAAKVVTRLAPD